MILRVQAPGFDKMCHHTGVWWHIISNLNFHLSQVKLQASKRTCQFRELTSQSFILCQTVFSPCRRTVPIYLKKVHPCLGNSLVVLQVCTLGHGFTIVNPDLYMNISETAVAIALYLYLSIQHPICNSHR